MKVLSGAARVFDEMDIFPMRVLAGAAAAAALMLASACGLMLITYMRELSPASRQAYEYIQLAQGLFGGGLRLLTLGCVSAVLSDILLRSERPLF